MMDDGELIDPDRITLLSQTGGQIAEVMVTKPSASGKSEYIVKSPIPTTDSDGLPNRLSIDRSSPYYTNCGAYVGVKIDGEEAPNCIEFCVSGGWVRLGTNAQVTRAEVRDAPKRFGKVEVYWRATPSRQVRRQIARLAR